MAIPRAITTEKPTNQLTIEQLIEHYAASDVEKFNIFFRRMRNHYSQDCVRGCIRHLGRHVSSGRVGRQMLLWLTSAVNYQGALLDPLLISCVEVRQAATALRDADPQFYTKLAHFLQSPKTSMPTNVIYRVLDLIPSLGECGLLIPWLRSLAKHSNENIRLRSAKVLCEMRPTRAMVERQLQSSEPRARANALEALWKAPGADAKIVFRLALGDPDHRVVAKALVGLYLNNDSTAIGKMIEMAEHHSPVARMAVLTAMTKTSDPRCLITIRMLTGDRDDAVRHAASNFLAREKPPTIKPISPGAALAVAAGGSGRSSQQPQTAEIIEETGSSAQNAYWTPLFQLLS